jgi:hypothetical protein
LWERVRESLRQGAEGVEEEEEEVGETPCHSGGRPPVVIGTSRSAGGMTRRGIGDPARDRRNMNGDRRTDWQINPPPIDTGIAGDQASRAADGTKERVVIGEDGMRIVESENDPCRERIGTETAERKIIIRDVATEVNRRERKRRRKVERGRRTEEVDRGPGLKETNIRVEKVFQGKNPDEIAVTRDL